MAPQPNRERLAVVIVTWNVRDLTLDCLETLYPASSQLDLESTVYIVDNDSADGTVSAVREAYPQTVILEPKENLGFAAGNNVALRHLGFGSDAPDAATLPEYVLLLNPDTLVPEESLLRLFEGLQASGAGVAGANLTFGDGSFQDAGFRFPGIAQLIIDLFADVLPARLQVSALNGRYSRSLYEGTQPFEIDFPLGAVWLMKRQVLLDTGIFDERYHLYCEEIDWAMRIRSADWKIVTVPSAHIVHLGGQSTGQVKPRSVINLWSARLTLFDKHYTSMKNKLARLIIRLGMRHKLRRLTRQTDIPTDEKRTIAEAYQTVIEKTYKPSPSSYA